MKRYANESKWSHFYTSFDEQAKNKQKFIYSKIPENVTLEEIKEVVQELRSLYNFKDYTISYDEYNIKGKRNV